MIVVHPIEKESRYYWGIEEDAKTNNPRLVDGVWMAESLPPWRKSTKAVRIRLGNRALHIGLCRVMGEDDPLRGREDIEAPPEEISNWAKLGGDHDPTEEELRDAADSARGS